MEVVVNNFILAIAKHVVQPFILQIFTTFEHIVPCIDCPIRCNYCPKQLFRIITISFSVLVCQIASCNVSQWPH